MKLNGTAPRVTEVDGIRRITIEEDKAWLEATNSRLNGAADDQQQVLL